MSKGALKQKQTTLECVRCGKRVIRSQNPFKPTHHTDKLYCDCEEIGPPLMPIEPIETKPPATDPIPDGINRVFMFWDAITDPGLKVVCFDCLFSRTIQASGGISPMRSANAVLAGHSNKGCGRVRVIGRRVVV